MDFWQSLNGSITVSITSAEPTALLREVQARGITLGHVKIIDDLTLVFEIRRQDMKALQQILDRRGEKMEQTAVQGLYWKCKSLLMRPVLVLGILLLLAVGMFLPTRVYFFRVEGNLQVPTRLILDVASDCGIYFGASRRDVRSEQVKNALLAAIPQLQWAGVNTSGCVATISVRERQLSQKEAEEKGVSSIVAIRDGIISELVVTKGSSACKVGQAVQKGQVLISGYTDCGISIRADRAKGEIYAVTRREISLSVPSNWQLRGKKTGEQKKYSLIIGKKRINLYQGSGILDSSCVKMYQEDYLTLPGGFQLPIAIVTESWTSYEQSTLSTTAEESTAKLNRLAEKYLQSQMVAGKILSRQESLTVGDGIFTVTGEYGCIEMIGCEKSEEIIAP